MPVSLSFIKISKIHLTTSTRYHLENTWIGGRGDLKNLSCPTLSLMGEKFQIFAKDLNHPKIIEIGIFKPRTRIFIIFRMKKSILKIFDFQLKNES